MPNWSWRATKEADCPPPPRFHPLLPPMRSSRYCGLLWCPCSKSREASGAFRPDSLAARMRLLCFARLRRCLRCQLGEETGMALYCAAALGVVSNSSLLGGSIREPYIYIHIHMYTCVCIYIYMYVYVYTHSQRTMQRIMFIAGLGGL